MGRWLRLFVAMGGALVCTACGAGGASGTHDEAGRDARVHVASSDTSYRDLGQALLFARDPDTLRLAPGLYRGALSFEGKRLRVEGPPEGQALLLVPPEGIRVGPGAHLDLVRVSLQAEGPPTTVAALRVEGGSLSLTDVVARDLPRPALALASPDKVLSLLRCRFERCDGPALVLEQGSAWVGATVVRDSAESAFRVASGAGPLHLSHVTALGVGALVDAPHGASGVWSASATISDDAGAGMDPDDNLLLTPDEARRVFPAWADGDARPAQMTRWDGDGLDYGALPSPAGLARAAQSLPRWLDLFDDRAVLRALALLPPDALGNEQTHARLMDTFYRRVASFLGARQPGLLARDLLLVMPFAPASWHLESRLQGARHALAEGLPGRVLVVGPPSLSEPVGARLEAIFREAYPWRDPNQAWRVVIEIERPLEATTDVEALERTHTFANPEHDKRVRALDMLAHRRDTLADKLTRLRAQVRGMEAKRAATGRADPDPVERRVRDQVAEAEREQDQVLRRQVDIQQELGQQPAQITCVFRGQRLTTRESATLLLNGAQRIEPTRVRVELRVAPEPACRFEGLTRSWSHPAGDTWLADAALRGVLASAWLPARVQAIQQGLAQARLARATTAEADAFFRLLIQDLGLLRMAPGLAAPTPPTPDPRWLDLSSGADGYPVVSCPFVPALPAQGADDPLRLLARLRPALDAYARQYFLEPLFLWESALAR